MLKKRTFRTLMSGILAVCMLLSLCPMAFAQYDDEDDSYGISTQAELLSSLEELEAEAEETGTEYDGYIFKLTDGAVMPYSALEDSDSSVEAVEFSEELYTAESTDDIFGSVDAADIEYIEPNYIVELFDADMFSAVEPNDQYYKNGSQWNLETLNVPAAWEYGLEGQSISDDKSVVVAVIDSGINRSHQDLDESHILEGYSYVTTNTANTDDTMGHGTFCAGQIFATKDNEVGIAGIVPEVYIMPLRVFGSSNQAYTSDIVSAINYATGTGEVDVISMSLGGEGSSASMKAACEAATESGILVIAAAGNDGDYTINYPAAYACVIGVGSVGTDNSHTDISYFSQRGVQNVFCVAPGFKIVSTYYDSTTSYYRGNGTSFACPEVAALAAIAKSIDRSITQDEFMQVIIDTSTDLGTAGRDDVYGYGLVNFQTAIEALIGGGSGDTGVTVVIENENGESVENAEITITKYGETEAIQPNDDGTYTLEKGKYTYTVTADKYQTATGVFSVITGSRILRIVLEGEAYPVSIAPVNTRGETLDKAVISIKNAKGAEMTSLEQGVYEFQLKNGTYTYSISATSYYPQTGTFTIKDEGTSMTVKLYGDIDVASAKLRTVNADGETITGVTVTLFNAEGGEVEPYTDGYYKLYPGEYTYTATSNSYLTERSGFTIGEEQKGTIITVDVPMNNPIVWVYFEVVPINADVSVWNSAGELIEPEEPGQYKLLKGDYTYEISAENYETARGSFTITTSGMTIDTELVNKEDEGFATVAFISNGGTAVEAQRVELGSKLAEPDEPTKSGYTFDGWYKEPSLTTPWSFETDVVTASVSLYAKWIPRTYKIIYMFGDTVLEGLEPSTHTYGSAVKELPVPTIEGQKFMYWCSDAALQNKVTSISPAKASDAVLHAYCEPDNGSYTVSFDTNGGTELESVTVGADTGYLIPVPAAPEKTGYTFAGWYSDSALTESWNFDTDKVTWHMTLYAAWTANTYKITYMSGGEKLTGLEPTEYTYNEAVYTLPRLTAGDKVFSGWYSDSACTVRVRNIPAGSLGDLTLYALWTEKKNSVPDDCDYEADENGNYPTVDSEGYTLIYTQEQLEGLSKYTVTSSTAMAMKKAGTVPKFRLAQSILLTGEWAPIGGTNNKFFCGEFDGAGHTIAGLSINNESLNQALFGAVHSSKIGGLYLYGTVNGGSTAGGLIGESIFTDVYDVTVDVEVTSRGVRAGGIAATFSGGTISSCANLGNITCTGSVTSKSVQATGGIIGMAATFSSNAVVITDCYNSGDITNASGTPTGGITGYLYNNASSITNCYNTGDITQTGETNAYYGVAGGICGFTAAGGIITSCYSTGKIESTQSGVGITGYKVEPELESCFYLEGTAEHGVCYLDDYGHYEYDSGTRFPYSQEHDYADIISALGAGFLADDGSLNGGYPILAWQSATSAAVTFELTDAITGAVVENAVITVDGAAYADGASLAARFHNYTVSKPGYETISSRFFVGREDRTVSVVMSPVYYEYTVKVSPADAELTLKNEQFGVIEPESSSVQDDVCTYTFRLARSSIYGEYSYTAEKYGYGTVSGDFSVNQAGKMTVELTASDYQTVTFDVIPASAEITVSDEQGRTIAPYDGSMYRLVEGKFTYTIKAEGYRTVSGSITIPGSTLLVSVVMELNTGWDGTSDTSWYTDSENTYYISYADQLAGLRDLCNAGNTFEGKTIVLNKDIDLSGLAWTPMGSYNYEGTKAFRGTLDGAGHTISGLNASGKNYVGFIGCAYNAEIKNLTLEGSVSGVNYVGGFAGYITGTSFTDCVNNVSVTSTGYQVGGFAGVSSGLSKTQTSAFTRCVNNGAITSTDTAHTGTNSYAVGGIIGCISGANVPVSYCKNTGAITAATQSVGGIVGAVSFASGSGSPRVEYCFNTGTVSNSCTNGYTGGIVGNIYGGYAKTSVLACLNLGSVVCTADDSAGYVGGVIGYNTSSYTSVSRSFYYYATASLGLGNKEDVEDQVEAFGSESDNGYAEVVEKLDEAFMLSGGNIILKWENTSATYIVQLSVSYDTSLNRTSGDKPVFTVRSDSEEFAVTSGGRAELPSGTYYYIASQNGYDVAKGSFVVDGKDTAVSIKLYALRYDLEVTCVPADAAVTVTNVNGTEQKAVSSENGVWHFSLYNGTYSYTVSAYGFDPKSGSVTVRYENTRLGVELEGLKSYNTSFVLKPVSGSFTTAPVLSIFQDNALVEKLTGAESSAVLAAGNYRYVARASGFSTTTGEFTVSGESTVEITMALPGGGAVADTEWYYLDPDAGRFEIGSADELYGLAQLVNEGADDFSGKTLVLTADINMSSIAWTPIGSWSGLHFKGEFDGAGHSIVITNGTISGNEVCFGLFGYLDGANVHDLTLRGNINVAHSSDSDSSVIVYVGSLAGFAANSTISRVSSQLNVIVKAVVGSSGVLDVGGLIGWANGDTLDSCSNLGGITTEISTLGLGSNKVCLAYGGGLIGYGMSMTPGLSVTNCYNTGAVSCTAPSFAKAGGIVGVLAGSSSFIMRNCYNAGTMTVSGSSQSAAAALLNESKGTLANNYYLDSSAPSTVGIAKTADELRSAEAVEDLGGAYTYVEGRFPKLAWEKTAGTITIGSMPDKLSYTDLEDFDETGMTLVVSYEDGTSETITSGWTVVNGKGLRVDMGGKSDSSTAEVMIDIEYRGLVLQVPVTVKQTVHLIDNSELKLSIPAPKAGAKAEPITIETDKYTATVTWMQAGEEFDGTFEKDTFYRANVSIKAKYETGSIWYGFENSSVMSVDGVLEILYKSVKSVAADNGDKTLMTAELTFPATGERKAAFNEKALHLYYEGDSNADYSVDRLLGMKLTITAEGKSVSYTLRELEQRMLAGECVESTYSRYDGVSRTSAKLTGISLYTLCAESGLFAMNLSDSSLITIGGAEYTWGQIRATGSAYDAEGKLTAQGLPTVISVASDGTPYTAANGPMQAARPMASADDVSFPSWTKTDSVVLTGAEYLDTHSVTFVVTNDTGAVISGPDITVTDVYGNVIPAENGVYMLNDGQNYSYRVSARGYGARVGETGAVTRDAVITVSLFECWDGVTLTEPEIDDNGYYLIYTAEELMWFNRNATGTESVKLMADITLNSDDDFVNVWNTMNTSETRTGYFSGIFDGNGHTIHNLYIQLENLYTIVIAIDGTPLLLSSRQDNAAMFGYLSGIVRDLGVTGRIEVLDRPDSQYATWMQIGGIAGYMTGGATISGCYTDIDIVYDVGKETTVTGGYPDCGFPEYCDVYAGGIVGSLSKGTVTNCYSTGSISVVGTRKTSVGGIVGGLRGANAAVEYCYSTGSITAIPTENSDSGFISGAGGIVGDGAAYSAGDGGSIMYCFALGDSINCGTSDKVRANCVIGTVNDTNVIKYNYSNTAMNVTGGIHDDSSFSRNSVNGAQIDLARAKASLTPYTNIGWSNAIWKSDDAYSLPTFYWQRSGGRTDIYSVSVVSDTAAAVFTGGVAGTEGAYTTTGSSTISFTVKADKYKTADVVTVTGGKLTSAGGYYTVSGITGDVVITITTKWLYGDVNGDGAVNAIDAMLALRASVGAVELSAEQKIVADVDGNGSVNSTDAVAILRYGIGMLTELPINK